MEEVIKNLFIEWEKRVNKTYKSTEDLSNIQDTLDKNSKRLLSSILITNKKYMKEEVPLSYEYNEDTKEFEDVDIMNKITPFVTDKTNIFETLENERLNYLENNKANNSEIEDT